MRGREAAGVQGGWYLRQIYRFRGWDYYIWVLRKDIGKEDLSK